jgi:hypothetical protein
MLLASDVSDRVRQPMVNIDHASAGSAHLSFEADMRGKSRPIADRALP